MVILWHWTGNNRSWKTNIVGCYLGTGELTAGQSKKIQVEKKGLKPWDQTIDNEIISEQTRYFKRGIAT